MSIYAALSAAKNRTRVLMQSGNGFPTGFKKVATDNSRTVEWTGTADMKTIDAYLEQAH